VQSRPAAYTHPVRGLRRKSPSRQSCEHGCSLFPWLPPIFPSMFPWQPIHQVRSSSSRSCPLCFGPVGASCRLSTPETPIFSHVLVCGAGEGSVGQGWAGSQVSQPWDFVQVGLLRWGVISERHSHAAPSSPLTNPAFLGFPAPGIPLQTRGT